MNGCNSDTEISDQHEVDVGHKRKLRRSSRKKEKTQFLKMDDTEQEGSKVQPLKKKTKKSHHVPFNKNTSKEKSRNSSKSGGVKKRKKKRDFSESSKFESDEDDLEVDKASIHSDKKDMLGNEEDPVKKKVKKE